MTLFDDPDGATPLDPNEVDGLILTHLTTRGELNQWEQQNIHDAYEWLDSNPSKDILTPAFIRQLHAKMFGNVWRWAGQLRTGNKNIGVSWERIAVELKNLGEDARAWQEFNTYPPDEFAARFHHRLVRIHPFANGNGRHARLMADVILERIFKQPPFTWGSANLIKEGDVRSRYIAALKAADQRQDYALLLEFVRS